MKFKDNEEKARWREGDQARKKGMVHRDTSEIRYSNWKHCSLCLYEGPMNQEGTREKCPECGDERFEKYKVPVPDGVLLVDYGEIL